MTWEQKKAARRFSHSAQTPVASRAEEKAEAEMEKLKAESSSRQEFTEDDALVDEEYGDEEYGDDKYGYEEYGDEEYGNEEYGDVETTVGNSWLDSAPVFRYGEHGECIGNCSAWDNCKICWQTQEWPPGPDFY